MIASSMRITTTPRLSRGIMRRGAKVRLCGPGAVIWFKGPKFKPESGFEAFVVKVERGLVYLGMFPRLPSICACAQRCGLEVV